MNVNPEVMAAHNREQKIAKERALSLLSGKPTPACPVEFAMIHGLPIWAVKHAIRMNHEKT